MHVLPRRSLTSVRQGEAFSQVQSLTSGRQVEACAYLSSFSSRQRGSEVCFTLFFSVVPLDEEAFAHDRCWLRMPPLLTPSLPSSPLSFALVPCIRSPQPAFEPLVQCLFLGMPKTPAWSLQPQRACGHSWCGCRGNAGRWLALLWSPPTPVRRAFVLSQGSSLGKAPFLFHMEKL